MVSSSQPGAIFTAATLAAMHLTAGARILQSSADYARYRTYGWDIPGSRTLAEVSDSGSITDRIKSCANACDGRSACDKFVLTPRTCQLKGTDTPLDAAEYVGGPTLVYVAASELGRPPAAIPDLVDFTGLLGAVTLGEDFEAEEQAAAGAAALEEEEERAQRPDVATIVERVEEQFVRDFAKPDGQTTDFDLYDRQTGWDIVGEGDLRTVRADGDNVLDRVEACKLACDAENGCNKFTFFGDSCRLMSAAARFDDVTKFDDNRRIYYRDIGQPRPDVPSLASLERDPTPEPAPVPAPKPAPVPEPAAAPAKTPSRRSSLSADDFVHQPPSLKGSLLKIQDIQRLDWRRSSDDVDRCAERCIDKWGDECLYVQTHYSGKNSNGATCTIARACSGSGCKTVAAVNVRSYDKNRANCQHPQYLAAYQRYKNQLPRGAGPCINITDDNKIARW